MKIINSKIIELSLYLTASMFIMIFLPIVLKNASFIAFGLIFCIFFGVKLYQLVKIKKKQNVFAVKVKCTGKTLNFINITTTKKYEFEPIDKKEYPDIIELSLANDDSKNGFGLKSDKIRVGSTYLLLFKESKNGEKIADNINFIGFERIIA